MTTFLIILLFFGALGFYYYKKAKNKQAELRAKARNHYSDIQNAIFVWASDKTNEEKISLALSALEIYDNWRKEAEFFPISYKKLTAERFEIVDEWTKIFEEDKNLRNPRIADGAKSVIANEFSYNVQELRELKHKQRLSQT